MVFGEIGNTLGLCSQILELRKDNAKLRHELEKCKSEKFNAEQEVQAVRYEMAQLLESMKNDKH